MLYDRIEKKPIAVNINYVTNISKKQNLQTHQGAIEKKKPETMKEEKRHAMK